MVGPALAPRAGSGVRHRPKMEPGLVTLAKIVGVLVVAIGLIPMVFLLWPSGDRSEPKDEADAHH